jgi:hypothetical protein
MTLSQQNSGFSKLIGLKASYADLTIAVLAPVW